MHALGPYLQMFWQWSGISPQIYAQISDPTTTISPFYFPHFNAMRNKCIQLINTHLNSEETNNFLTCLALDAEDEMILSACIIKANDQFLTELICNGCHHIQPEARWQIAEILRSRYVPNGIQYIDILCADSNEYVKKRALFAKESQKQTNHSLY